MHITQAPAHTFDYPCRDLSSKPGSIDGITIMSLLHAGVMKSCKSCMRRRKSGWGRCEEGWIGARKEGGRDQKVRNSGSRSDNLVQKSLPPLQPPNEITCALSHAKLCPIRAGCPASKLLNAVTADTLIER
jgi:hypothetical protein